MEIEKKYEQWKAITESDFVTLFIKTWFTYIAVLRELNPDVNVFTAEGMPRGDKPFLNAFKEGIMPIVQKELPIEAVAQELFRMYPISMRKVIDVFPQYFFQTFFRVNENFCYSERSMENFDDGSLKERYDVKLHIVDRYRLKFYLGMSGRFRNTTYNEEIKKQIDLRPIIEATVSKHQTRNAVIQEIQFMRDFYEDVLKEVENILQRYLSERLPLKRYNQTINRKIQDACRRLFAALNVKFEYNYRFPHAVTALSDPNSYAIITELPFNGFGRIEPDNLYSTNEETYSQLVATKGVDWFASFVYSLRNALFHEIISPLDTEWQTIFKSAYLVLKQYSDICIEIVNKIVAFPTSEENAVFDYVTAHQSDIFSGLADDVELIDYSRMTLNKWTIEHGKISLEGWFLVKLKLQNGTPEAIAAGDGNIEAVEKGYDFNITLNDDFSIVIDSQQNERIAITLQGT